METQVLLPTAAELRELLENLFGRDVTVRVSATAFTSAPTDVVGTFVDDSDQLRAVSLSDLTGAAYLGAALALMPKGLANEAIKAGSVGDELADNAAEVLNVLSALLNGDERPHVRFVGMAAAAETPGETLDAAAGAFDRLDLTFEVKGYGEGHFSLVVV